MLKTKEYFRSLSTDELLLLLNPDYNLGRTVYVEPSKKWIVQHNYFLIAEVNCLEDKVEDFQTFGYPIESITEATTESIYGNTAKETLINFYIAHPELIIAKI